jgi:ElaB/YqjD/DUF883 family membrane-anchored ribosome-binding protein
MNALPKWALSNPFPAIHDFESLSVIEQTTRIYGAMNQLITEYNNLVDQLETYKQTETEAREDFETKITKVIREFLCEMEKRFEDVSAVVAEQVNQAIQEGRLSVTEHYDTETESLNMFIGGEVSE